ncbi:hypothetical protein SGQ83_03465 [Flavobacterium sp. Fl-318]|uniref:Lipoprotein n=1 Tax=Flavobacterium cupriresistens TaxID=2893885 RepID=A0ABU4R834_9FLAO|nr:MULTISPECIES: hypothetical protein [unclassified Flavobacterium]MDX6188396.1 hypothetical protein [Flavobacterium sp. Fl-318]UFH44933.1 hypothetical protein LNP23_12185 [Flavobacterium sp. F-323]
MTLSKRIGVLVLLILISFTYSCSQKILPTSEVNYVSGNAGTITMRTIGNGSNEMEAISEAEKNAINVLLFRGLPESEQKSALVGTHESEEIEKHKTYFEKFYTQKRYKTFFMSSIPVSDFAKQKGGAKSLTLDVKVNLAALRTDLEQNNIIRKFGF